jgi:hypothetical protein
MSGLDQLPMWVVYDHPRDFPRNFVARKHVWNGHAQAYVPSADIIVTPDLDELHGVLAQLGLAKLDRMPGDDPVVLETWL